MNTSEQTMQQIQRFLNKIAQKFPPSENTSIITDIHVRVSQDSGELLAFNDDDVEITRCIVEQWIDYKADDFYQEAANELKTELKKMRKVIDNLGILKPYSFILEDDDKENVSELYLVDDDIVIVDEDLMKNLDKDLDSFFDDLMKK
nr:hypothetical protein [Prevotella sp.]